MKTLLAILSLASAVTLLLIAASFRWQFPSASMTYFHQGNLFVNWYPTEEGRGGKPLVESTEFWGFYYIHARRAPDTTAFKPVSQVDVSLFSPLAVFSALPVAVYTRRFHRWYRARQMIAKGLCVKCGYDLRGTPDRCPECGTAAKVVA